MQNANTLVELGFQKNIDGVWFWRGTHHVFTAKVVDYNGPIEFVELFKVSKEVDNRPNSDRKGKYYQSFIKDCCSEGSVQRALIKYDTL